LPDIGPLRDAHAGLLDAGVRCTLDRRKRLLPWNQVPGAARVAISSAVRDAGLAFESP
jgi:hypothetical protein